MKCWGWEKMARSVGGQVASEGDSDSLVKLTEQFASKTMREEDKD